MTSMPDEAVGEDQTLSNSDQVTHAKEPGPAGNQARNDLGQDRAAKGDDNHPEEDPAEGSRDTVERELDRQGQSNSHASEDNAERTRRASIPRLSRDRAAMIFVDNQTGLMASVESLHPERLKRNMLALRDTAAIYRLPVVLTASDPSNPQGPGPMLPELTEAFPRSEVIARTSIGAWDDPKFVSAVEATGRDQLIISGIATDAGVAFTALGARQAGYDVFVVADASASWSDKADLAALIRMTAAGVVTMSWVSVAAELQADWSRPNSRNLAELLRRNIARWNYIAEGEETKAAGNMDRN